MSGDSGDGEWEKVSAFLILFPKVAGEVCRRLGGCGRKSRAGGRETRVVGKASGRKEKGRCGIRLT